MRRKILQSEISEALFRLCVKSRFIQSFVLFYHFTLFQRRESTSFNTVWNNCFMLNMWDDQLLKWVNSTNLSFFRNFHWLVYQDNSLLTGQTSFIGVNHDPFGDLDLQDWCLKLYFSDPYGVSTFQLKFQEQKFIDTFTDVSPCRLLPHLSM